jgi:histidine decarboxylase
LTFGGKAHSDEDLKPFHKNFLNDLSRAKTNAVSFPCRMGDFGRHQDYLNIRLNNQGDPYAKDYSGLRTKNLEVEVLKYFADLYRLEGEQFWGYMPQGSTEANFQALWFAKNYLQRKSTKAPIVLYTSSHHSSILRSIKYMGLQAHNNSEHLVPEVKNNTEIEIHEDASINLESLKKVAYPFIKAGHPIISIFTIGTTTECGIDDAKKGSEILRDMMGKDWEENLWIHSDSAWCGPYMRLLKMAHEANPIKDLEGYERFDSDFSVPGVKSHCTSIHKWIPSPFPGSVLLLKNADLLPTDSVDSKYIRGKDLTFTTSRSGHIPLFTWDYLMRKGMDAQIQEAVYACELSQYVN